jgi:pyruvate formate lyase activating enzyme
MLDESRILNENLNENSGMVLRIERGSVYDGDGFRTVIFLKGCPLRCQWCATPESQSFEFEQFNDYSYGEVMTVENVMKEVRKDSCCYFHSGGGLTLSGGEILAQSTFTLSLLKAAWEECINTAIETTFFASWETVKSILPYVNTAFVDIKMFDNQRHETYVGCSNELILENLMKTNDLTESLRLIIRIPIIPGVNDSTDELDAIGKFCSKLVHLDYVQLLPYHRLGTRTYEKMGRDYLLSDVVVPSSEHMEKCRSIIGKHIKKVI